MTNSFAARFDGEFENEQVRKAARPLSVCGPDHRRVCVSGGNATPT